MSNLLSQIGLALEAFKSRQQDIHGVNQRAYKDLFAAANASMLTSNVHDLILQSYEEMITPNAPKTSLLAAISQHHGEIIAGCRVLTSDEGIQRALVDAANTATSDAFRLIYTKTGELSPASRIKTKERTKAPRSRAKITPKKSQNPV
jgi:hypothetical protein